MSSPTMSTIADLVAGADWSPLRLLQHAYGWPTSVPVQPLEQLAVALAPSESIGVGAPVLVPSGIDPTLGAIEGHSTRYQGAGYVVGPGSEQLHAGDLVITRGGRVPAFLVNPSLEGALLSREFSVFRFALAEDAHWAWAVWNSRSGVRLRDLEAVSADALDHRRTRIGELEIPWPEHEQRAQLLDNITAIARRTQLVDSGPARSWWTTSDLHRTEWRFALASPDPSALFEGVPIAELAAEILSGARQPTTLPGADADADALPVITGSVLAGRPTTTWASPDSGPTSVLPGDVLVAEIGSRAYARVADRPAALGRGVHSLRLKDPALGPAITRFLNSREGAGRRRLLSTGSSTPWLSAADLGRLGVPESALSHTAPGALRPLADELEDLLWNR